MSGEEQLDPRTAAALIAQTEQRTRRSLEVGLPRLYAAWGLAWLLGLGAMWVSVRGQDPYRGPGAASAVVLGVLLAAAVVVTVVTVARATRGVEGVSEMQGRLYGLSWPVGFAAWFAVMGGVARQGASEEVMGLLGACGPLLVTSVIYLVGAAIWLERSMFLVGAWLALVTAVGAFTGPVSVLLVDAVAGGGGFLVAAGYLATTRRRSR